MVVIERKMRAVMDRASAMPDSRDIHRRTHIDRHCHYANVPTLRTGYFHAQISHGWVHFFAGITRVYGWRVLTVKIKLAKATTAKTATITTKPLSEMPHSDASGGVTHSSIQANKARTKRLSMNAHAAA